ncbi:hypothetical protein AMR72_00620 [Flavobacterium psychrophilum]|nr:hypothetical protein AMR72_00620 [Flavobacterium psychrophilum]AOE51152.1 hypothetical protein ALW18_00620 [Flavobacterium psychrophilum]
MTMKKITLSFLFLLCCFFGYAQLEEETFEGAAFPPPGWGVYDNGVGLTYSWQKSPAGNQQLPPYQGATAAYIQRESALTTPEDWLITKQFTVPENGILNFYSRLGIVGDQGGIYQIKISTSANQADLADYTLMQEWTESQINGVQQREYVLKTLNFAPEFYGQQVYVAFIMKANFADRWLVDNVSVTEKCLNPTNLTATNSTTSTVDLNWDSPSNATKWDIEIVGEQDPFTGSGQLYTGTLPYTVTNLEINKGYKYQIRAVCVLGGKSDWIGPVFFSTNRLGDTCSDPIVVSSLPYNIVDNTSNAKNYYSGSPGANCGTSQWGSYLGGNDVIYKYTPIANEIITIKATELTNDTASMFVYNSCADIGTNCIAADFNDYVLGDLAISEIDVTAGIDYYILLSAGNGVTSYNFTIQRENCKSPTALTVSGITTTSAMLSWTEAETATSWQYVVQTEGLGLPTGSGTDINATNFNATTLNPSTNYEFYVRANCGDGTYSTWAGPLRFSTLCNPLSTPFYESFEEDSATEFCWIVNDGNNDGEKWDINDQWNGFNSQQSAAFYNDINTDNDDMLISPTLTIGANQRLRYKYQGTSSSLVHFSVKISTTGIDPDNFTTDLLPLTPIENNSYLEKIIDLSAYEGQNVNIAWYVPSGSATYSRVRIDDVYVENWPACAVPLTPSVSDITTTSAQLAWTKGHNETAWEIALKDLSQGTLPPADGIAGTPVTTNPYLADNLTPNTEYTYYVRASCGSGEFSEWVGPVSFRTECVAFTVPFFEGFNSNSQTEACWTKTTGNGGTSSWNLNGQFPAGYEGDQYAQIYTGASNINDWLISPQIILTGNDRLRFHYRTGSGNARFRVMISTTGKDIADFTTVILPSAVYNNESFIKEIISLQGYTGPVYVAWHADSPSAGYAPVAIDNVVFEAIPDCADIDDLAEGNTTTSSIEYTWSPADTETQWEIIVQPATFPAPTATTNGLPATSPYIATTTVNGQPLESGTLYAAYVRAVCDSDSKGAWTDRVAVPTMITNDECATAIDLTVNTTPDCTIVRGGTTSGATISTEAICNQFGTPSNDVWFTFTALAQTHTINITPLTQNTSFGYALYEGACGNLNNLLCASGFGDETSAYVRDLTVGQKYTIRISEDSFNPNFHFSICISTPVKPIATNTTQYTVEELVRDVLVNSGCAQVSNVTFTTGSTFGGPDGIGYFNKNGSDFPFESGIVLSTGNANDAAGPNFEALNGMADGWVGDPDLEQIIQEGTGLPMVSHNASILEFDFIPLRDQISFDFMFASEEYGTYQCEYSDAFAFILTDAQGNKRNLAVVPGTNTPVSVITIRDGLYNDTCDSENGDFFSDYYGVYDGENFGSNAPINYNGRTTVMKAQGDVIMGQPYHIKMVIADRGDERLDSAVFLGAESFDLGKLNLGIDLTVAAENAICEGSEHVLNSNLDAEAFIIKWTKDGVEIPNENGATLTVTEAGTYAINAELLGLSCTASDSIIIEYYPDVTSTVKQPLNLTQCNNEGIANFDVTSNTAIILDELDATNYEISYHTSVADAEAGENAMGSSYENIENPQTIYVRIEDNTTSCYGVTTFTLAVNPAPEFALTEDRSICENSDTILEVTSTAFETGDATYAWTKDGVILTETTSAITVSEPGVYEVTVRVGNCTSSDSVNVTTLPAPIADVIQNVEQCDSYTLLPLSAGNRYFTATGGDNGSGTEITAGSAITTSQTIYVFAQSNTIPVCTAESSFEVTINPTPRFTLGDNQNVCMLENAVITVSAQNFELADAIYEWTLNGVVVGTDSSITATDFGSYDVTVTIGDCKATQSINVTQNTDAIKVVITEDCEPGVYTLTANDIDGSYNTDIAKYSWTGPEGFASKDRAITPDAIGIYTVTVTTADGCIGEDSMPVTSTTCDIPRGVSPNNDSKNDNFDLSSLGVRKLSIFNRYGQEVYTKSNYTNEWVGQGSNGKELPTGTYFYMVERSNGESKTGWVYLNREE